MYKLTLLTQWIYVATMAANFIRTLENNVTASKMLGIVFLDCFTVTLCMRTVILFKEKETLKMICSFLQFEQLNPEGKMQTN